MDNLLEQLINFLPIIIIAIIALILIASGYVKTPPDTAIIISGFRKEPRVIIGRTGLKIPFIERLDKLPLQQMTVEIRSARYIPTLDFICTRVDAIAKVKIGTEKEMINLAMQNFLNRLPEEISTDLQDPLQAHIRELIGTLTLEDINNNQEKFAKKLHVKAATDMQKLGIEIISLNIQSVDDENGLIKAMGVENSAEIHKSASIMKAEVNREIVAKQAEAEKAANDARARADLEIAQRNHDLQMKQADLKEIAAKRQAIADAAFDLQTKEQERIIEEAIANADIARREREVELKQREAEIMEHVLDAEIKKTAAANKFKEQQEADSRLYIRTKEMEAAKIEAEADHYIQEQIVQSFKAKRLAQMQEADSILYAHTKEAEGLKVKADAEKYVGDQEAGAIKARGLAEAAAIQAKGFAEAKALEQRAEAMQKYGQAAMLEMVVNVLPEVAKNIAEPLSAITINSAPNQIPDISESVPQTMANIMDFVYEGTGIDIKEALNYHNEPIVIEEAEPENESKASDSTET